MAPVPRLRAYAGPSFLSYGFRPFFLFASIYAGVAIVLWLSIFVGELALPTLFVGRDWHVHEMLFGFLAAVVAGFLLTAIPNWTGRLPLQRGPLLVLVSAWAAGRVAVSVSAWTGWLPAAVVDLSFLFLLTAATAREIFAGRNWRNLKVLAVLVALLGGNALFHLEAHLWGTAEYGTRVGIAATLVLVMLIGGRIVPSFTRNWLAKTKPGRMPVPYGSFDRIAMASALPTLALWVCKPQSSITGAALLASGAIQAVQLARWAGDRTWGDRLVLVLHVAYAFVPLGFLLIGAASLGFVPAGAGIHAWTGGALGMMTLAVMSRASLGHTGRPLAATPTLQALYGLAGLSVVARICASLHPAWFAGLLPLAAVLWAAAFVGFAAAYWRVLTGPKIE
ncbi:NnrS family protein [Methylobacterium durans]|uniref:Short-chain dehydrogenase n=1 Tax=Methylobacterium durans TaxID=2202825 RepID=A0A2U8WFL0_9HYPH|nr:NnrS family protein [Methylobacterium durans]AWN44328.1 short-chain dehydrogenase [Methylobacterium durans]